MTPFFYIKNVSNKTYDIVEYNQWKRYDLFLQQNYIKRYYGHI